MGKVTYIDFEIERKTLGLVLKAFNDLFENWYNPKIVDTTQVYFQREELQNSIESLQNYHNTGGDLIIIRMGVA